MKISVGIVTTKGREEILKKTLLSLGSEKRLHIFCDLKKGMFFNHREAWRRLFEMSDTALLLQDDISASYNWFKTVSLFADKFPNQLIFNFYAMYGNGRPKNLQRMYHFENGLWEQAILIRKPLHDVIEKSITPELLEKNKMSRRAGDYHHDSVIKNILNKIKVKQMKVFPPFFQHRDEVSSLGNPRTWQGKPRQCEFYLGDDVDSYKYFNERLF